MFHCCSFIAVLVHYYWVRTAIAVSTGKCGSFQQWGTFASYFWEKPSTTVMKLKIFTSGAWTLKWKVTSENRHTSEHFWTESECAWPAMPERPLPQSQHHWVSFPELCSCVTPTKMCVRVFDLMRQWRTLFLHSPNSFRPPAHTHLCRHR